MNQSARTIRIFFLFCAVLFSLQVIPRWWGDSIVIDEEWELTSAYHYWKSGNVWSPYSMSAPGALCALPLLALQLRPSRSPQANFRAESYWLLFMSNQDKLRWVTLLSRAVSWLLGLAIGYLLYRLVRDGPLLGASALCLWAFDPTLLAYSGIAKSDLAVTLWFFLTLLFFSKIQASSKPLPYLGLGALCALSIAARYNGLILLPILLALEVFHRLGSKPKPSFYFRKGCAFLAGLLGTLSLFYLPGTFLQPNHPWPLSFFWSHLSDAWNLRPAASGLTVFFAGRFWENGSYLNFPYHFFFKNTLPFLTLLAFGIAGAAMRKIQLPPWLWIPPVVYLGFFWFMNQSMTIHHALPAYPFLILIAARAFQWIWALCRPSPHSWVRIGPLLLLVWQAINVSLNFPSHIAYANEFLTAEQKASHLNSFNWNLGQDMKRLAETAERRGWRRVKLITYQRTDPYFYGLSWEPWTTLDLSAPQFGTVYVLDAALTRGEPFYSNLFYNESPWVGRLPVSGNIGGTLYYYEIPGEPSMAPDNSAPINSFPYYPDGIPPYKSTLAKPNGVL